VGDRRPIRRTIVCSIQWRFGDEESKWRVDSKWRLDGQQVRDERGVRARVSKGNGG
jgi:hypothetical protein